MWCFIITVNDLGGMVDGIGRGKKLADDVVDIIRSRGGTAVANYGEWYQGTYPSTLCGGLIYIWPACLLSGEG